MPTVGCCLMRLLMKHHGLGLIRQKTPITSIPLILWIGSTTTTVCWFRTSKLWQGLMPTPDSQQPKYQIQDVNGITQQPSLAFTWRTHLAALLMVMSDSPARWVLEVIPLCVISMQWRRFSATNSQQGLRTSSGRHVHQDTLLCCTCWLGSAFPAKSLSWERSQNIS